MDSAGKLPSAITSLSLCPISQSTFNNSGDKIPGIPFNIVIPPILSEFPYFFAVIGQGNFNLETTVLPQQSLQRFLLSFYQPSAILSSIFRKYLFI
jgi:hypothetical protein